VSSREGKAPRRLSEPAVALLKGYSWPGNVRELQNICERAAVLAVGDSIDAPLLRPWLTGHSSPTVTAGEGIPGVTFARSNGFVPASIRNGAPTMTTNGSGYSAHPHGNGVANGAVTGSVTPASSTLPRITCDGTLTLEVIEREVILATLERNRGHRRRSAVDLGIGVRTLGLKIKKWKEEARIPLTT